MRLWGSGAQPLRGRLGKSWESESCGLESWEKLARVPKGYP